MHSSNLSKPPPLSSHSQAWTFYHHVVLCCLLKCTIIWDWFSIKYSKDLICLIWLCLWPISVFYQQRMYANTLKVLFTSSQPFTQLLCSSLACEEDIPLSIHGIMQGINCEVFIGWRLKCSGDCQLGTLHKYKCLKWHTGQAYSMFVSVSVFIPLKLNCLAICFPFAYSHLICN